MGAQRLGLGGLGQLEPHEFLQKPFTIDALGRRVAEVLASGQPWSQRAAPVEPAGR